MIHVGRRIREARDELGMSQADLAGKVGVGQGAVSYIERQEWVQKSVLERYAQALGKPASFFVQEDEQEQADSRERQIERAYEVVRRDPSFGFGARSGAELDVETKKDIVRLYEEARRVKLLADEIS